jgi:HK97 family phage major capsid protein
MNQELQEIGGKLEAKRAEWMGFYSQFEAVGDAQAKVMTGDDVAKFKAFEAEVTDLQKDFDAKRAIFESAEANRKAMEADKTPSNRVNFGKPSGDQKIVRLSDAFLAKGVSDLRSENGREFDIKDIIDRLQGKATMTTSANGYPPQVLRDGSVVPAISRPPQLLDFLTMQPTDQNGIKFMAQTVRTNTAAAKSEGSAADEATITYAESTDIISKIPVFIPVTDEELEDEPGLRALIDQDLILMVRQELDRIVTVGSGTPPEFAGIFAATNIQTQAKGADPTIDAIMKAIVKVRVSGRANAGVCVMHSTDHQNLALTRTADGLYILGSPTDSAVQRIWGLPIALSEALTASNAMVLDPFYFRVMMRTGVQIAITNSHASNFTSGIQTIRATVRAGLKKMRGQAACKVTGL